MTRSLAVPQPTRHRKGLLAALAATLRLFARRRHDRNCLAQLDPHLLRDIGLDDDTASRECAKPFWRA